MTTPTADPAPAAASAERPDRSEETRARAEILAPVRPHLAVAAALVFLSSVCTVVPYLLIVEAARVMLADRVDDAWPLLGWAVAVFAARALLYSGALFWTHLVDADNQLNLRRLIADTLRRVPLGWFGTRSSAEVKKALQDDVEAIHYLIAHAQVEFVAAITTPALTFIYLIWVDWRLALVLLAPLVGYAVALTFMVGRDHRAKMEIYQQLEKKTEATTIEFVDGIQVVRTFGQAGQAHARYAAAVEEFSDYFTEWSTPMTRIESAAGVLLNPIFLLTAILLAGLPMIGSGALDPVDLLPFLLLGLGLGSTVLTVGHAAQARSQADAAAVRIHRLLSTPPLERHDTAPGSSTPGSDDDDDSAAGTVRFENVHFAYREGVEVLRGVDLTLQPGTITALVGPSGAGKSTLAALLPRFHDVTGGRITIGGVDIRELAPEELYARVGFVFQDVRLLRNTVRANIAIAREGATDVEIERAARAARIHDRILALPNGYDSVIGVDAHLSGGEAQRLSIARALLADSPVLVLDEATAFADPESEAEIQTAIASLVAGRTVLVIAHRLHTITGVDSVVVVDSGRVVEQGTHTDLLAAGGTYARLWRADAEATAHLTGHDGGLR
ncbi:ABC transporter [Dietzia sp. NCCP-2495]|uniref:ABC transporter ATP-binding protein n=1 Tax=Dietzia sp. NCCP-2495 TaxID=2934675 RepID=UPI002231EA92|nr:ABC transporter ATP-binding protein [Dietzia sp. NCCP-2495]GLB63482.1 ABC transporter [Dietzia sp. NCCP-2495]